MVIVFASIFPQFEVKKKKRPFLPNLLPSDTAKKAGVASSAPTLLPLGQGRGRVYLATPYVAQMAFLSETKSSVTLWLLK